jgi:hypothetical protein
VRIGFVTVLRAGIVGAVTVVALLAVFTLDRNMVILIMIGFGAAMGVTLTPLAALGVIQAPEDEPGSLPGICKRRVRYRRLARIHLGRNSCR